MADYRVRCPKCGSRVPADVSFCPSCGTGLNDDLLILEELDSSVGRATRPRATPHGRVGRIPRPWLVLGAGVAAAMLVALVLPRKHNGPRPLVSPPAAAPTTAAPAGPPSGGSGLASTTTTTLFARGATRTVVFVAGTTVVERLDLDASASQTYDLSGPGQAITIDGIDVGVAVVSDQVIVQQGSNTIALPASLSGRPMVLGHSVGFLPSRQPGRVWLVSVPATGPVVREVDLSGRPTSAPSVLPLDWQPTAAVSTGVLLTSSIGFEVWDPLTNRVAYRSPVQATVVAAAGSQVAWQLFGCFNLCALHLTNLTTGVTSVLYPQPPEVVGGLQGGAFSPDGRFLAAGTYGPSGNALTIIDLQTQQTESVPAAGSAGGPVLPAWSPSGRWVFIVASSSTGTIYALQRGTTIFQTVPLLPPASGTLSIAAVPSS